MKASGRMGLRTPATGTQGQKCQQDVTSPTSLGLAKAILVHPQPVANIVKAKGLTRQRRLEDVGSCSQDSLCVLKLV